MSLSPSESSRSVGDWRWGMDTMQDRSPHAHLEAKDSHGTAHGLHNAIHAAHRQHGHGGSVTTYLVATYTGIVTDDDKNEVWWQAATEDGPVSSHTEAGVFITLMGSASKNTRQLEQQLLHPGPEMKHIFQPGAVDEFVVTCPDLGNITGVKLRIEPHNESAWSRNLWKVEKVVVTCLQHAAGGTVRKKKKRWLSNGCCASEQTNKGDHAVQTQRNDSNQQWHFVCPPHKRWVGEIPGLSYSTYKERVRDVEAEAYQAHLRACRLEAKAEELWDALETLVQQGETQSHSSHQNEITIADTALDQRAVQADLKIVRRERNAAKQRRFQKPT